MNGNSLTEEKVMADVKAKAVEPIAELEAMQIEAAAIDSETGPAPVGAAGSVEDGGAPVVDEAGELAGVLVLCATMVAPALPYVATIYTPETCQRIAQAAVPVMQKYGLSMEGLFGRWGPEIGLAIALAPVVVQTAIAHKHWRAAVEEEARNERMRREADARQHFENTRGLEAGALNGG